MQVFVTVGSTRFDALINQILSKSVLEALRSKGYTRLTIQCGNSRLTDFTLNSSSVDTEFESCGIGIKIWKFKSSLQEEYTKADLVISHAGSGTILEVLRMGKSLIVVPNATLLNNHQQELAEALSGLGHLLSSDIDGLAKKIQKLDAKAIVPFPPFDGRKFCTILDEEMGFL